MHFLPARAKSQSKQVEYVFSLSANHFQPASPASLKSPIRSLVVIVPKLKSLFSSFENLRGIVCPKSKVCQNRKVCLCRKKGQFLKDFSIQICLFFPFQLCPLTPEAMGTGGLRERSLSHSDKVNAGAKAAECTSASL